MNENLLCRRLQCWNSPAEVEAGDHVVLTARAKWIDGRTIVMAREVSEAMIVELPEVKCEVSLDKDGSGWLVIVVHGPAKIPARATICVRVFADIAMPMWLKELEPSELIVAKKSSAFAFQVWGAESLAKPSRSLWYFLV